MRILNPIKLWRSRHISKRNVLKVMKTFQGFGFDAMLFVANPDYPEARISIIVSADDPDNCYLPVRRLLRDLKRELKGVGIDFEYTIKLADGKKKKK